MGVKHKPWHWNGTLLWDTKLFSYIFAVSKPKTCVFKSKYLVVNMTDDEWSEFLEKSSKF